MSKYIKLEDAIDYECPLMDIWENCINCPLDNSGIEPCKMGKWLKSLPTIEVSEDYISKAYLEQEIEKQIKTAEGKEYYWQVWNNALDKVVELIENAPSVVPSRAEGEWIFKTIFPNDKSEFPMGYLVCSVCGSQHANATPCNYCDNCGAKIKETDDEEMQTQIIEFPDSHQKFVFTRKIVTDGDSIKIGGWEYKGVKDEKRIEE